MDGDLAKHLDVGNTTIKVYVRAEWIGEEIIVHGVHPEIFVKKTTAGILNYMQMKHHAIQQRE